MSKAPIRNPLREKPLGEIVEARYSRREILAKTAKLGLMTALASAFSPYSSFARNVQNSSSTLAFTEIAKNAEATHSIAAGYDVQVLLRWGDRITANAPAFDPHAQSAVAQLQQFGYNTDYTAFHPLPHGSGNSSHGLLCANNEYCSTYLMFPGLALNAALPMRTTREQVDIEMAAHGHSVVEIKKVNGVWQTVPDSPYNRRITPFATDIAISGPAAGHPRMQTAEDPEGRTVRGMVCNCAGGVTPWGSTLVCEETFDIYFMGTPSDSKEIGNHNRYGVGAELWYGWGRFYDRYDMGKEPREANRFGWVVEYDPYDPDRQPVKRTALGRFKHETATVVLAPNGRVIVYSGDDEEFEYIYRFVSNGKYNSDDRTANFDLLDDGVLSVAKFHEDGTMQWLPLVFGQNGLTPKNGFDSQGEVLIETRRAADIVGATPMDRPEGVTIHPQTGEVFVSLTNNTYRLEANAANPRVNNPHGHIIALQPPEHDHSADKFGWSIFLKGGNPAHADDAAFYLGAVSDNGWLSCPDNLAMDPTGRLWICTDGQPKTIKQNDGLYACDTSMNGNREMKLFFTGPRDCEITGPSFTPDGTTLFLSVQHPGDMEVENVTYENPTTRWPDFKADMPPRPSVIAITKKDGGMIGN